MKKYFDKNGTEIKAGMVLKFSKTVIERVYDIETIHGADLGISVSNEAYMRNHNIPESEREFVSLSQYGPLLQNAEVIANIHDGELCVLIELDYKGYYQRFAFLPEEFAEAFPEPWADMGNTIEAGHEDSYTVRPLVHIWYRATYVNDHVWNEFFTNMTDGIPESDVEENNLATVELHECKALQYAVEETTRKAGLGSEFIRNFEVQYAQLYR